MEDDIGIHDHCSTCFNARCTNKFCTTCPVVVCELQCGSVYHQCKHSEHNELCKVQKVPCINVGNGCSIVLPRSQTGVHLEHCPASVIRCSCQWNRWPMHSVDSRTKAPLLNLNYHHMKCSQLDVSLALRDQRMLLSALCVPKTTKRVLRNVITPKHPPVPYDKHLEVLDIDPSTLRSIDSLHDDTDDDDDEKAPWNNRDYPPGLLKSVYHKLQKDSTKQCQHYSEANPPPNEMDIMCRLCAKNKYIQNGLVGDGDLTSGANCSVDNKYSNPLLISVAQVENAMEKLSARLKSRRSNKWNDVDDTSECSSDKMNDVVMEAGCSSKNNEDECYEDKSVVNDCNEHHRPTNSEHSISKVNNLENNLNGCNKNDERNVNGMVGEMLDEFSNTNVGDDTLNTKADCDTSVTVADNPNLIDDDNKPSNKPRDNSVPWKLNEILGVDLNVETIAWYQSKSDSMYTFLCGQDFRRDEYCHHFRNVHNDIQPMLNNWLEQRCPLAIYGCQFSFRRFKPDCRVNFAVTHSAFLESFGISVDDGDSLKDDVCVTNVLSDKLNENINDSNRNCDSKVLDPLSDISDINRMVNSSANRIYESTSEIITSQKVDSEITITSNFQHYLNRNNSHSDTPEENLTDYREHGVNIVNHLPYIIWYKILEYLDPFSLCNLSVVCKDMRDVCSSVVEMRGVVVESWRRMEKVNDRARHWEASAKKWKFTTSFTPVDRWRFVSSGAISEHLRVCPYNKDIATYPDGPIKLMIYADTQAKPVLKSSNRTHEYRGGLMDNVGVPVLDVGDEFGDYFDIPDDDIPDCWGF